jgi:hypothetical protein
MSTKTITKRIALVAATALALGGFSVISAPQATAATPAFTGAVIGGGLGTGTVTAVVAAHGSVTRTAPTTWTVPLTLTVTGTDFAATDTFTVAGTTSTTSGTATSVLSGLAKASTSATSVSLTGTVTFTTAADTIASALVALDTYAMTYTVVAPTAGSAIAATAVNAVLAGSSGTLIAPTAGTGSTSSALLQQINGQATVKFVSGASDTSYTITSSGVGSMLSTSVAGGTATAAVNLNGTNAGSGVAWTPVTTIQTLSIITTSAVAGTQTITYQPIGANGIPGTAITATITWGSAPATSAQYSLVKLLDGAVSTDVTSATADTTNTTVTRTAGTQRFTIQVEINDQNAAALLGQTLGASISGPGLIGIANSRSATTATGRSLTIALTNEYGSVSVWGDGSAGAATLTITAANSAGVTTTLGTKTVTFVGSASKAVATQALKVAKAATQLGATGTGTAAAATTLATTPAFSVAVTDSNGNAVAAGATVKMTSSDATVITVGTCVEITASSGSFECSVSGAAAAVSGKTATVTFSVYSAATGLYDIVANALTFSIGGAIATVAVTLDNATYAAGETMVLTATAKDSSGNAAYDGQAPYQTIGSNKSLITLPATTKYIVGGVTATSATAPTLFAPATNGDFTISGLTIATVAATSGAAYSVSASVEGDATASLALDAANAATDAANNAYDEAQNATQAASDALAAVTALAAQVKSLIASVKKLTAAVAKLKK